MPGPTTNLSNDLTDTLKIGLIPLSVLAICSTLSTFTLLLCITYRLVWKHDYQAFHGYNQYVILIYNLLLADLQQALAFLISLNWLRLGRINSPSATCFTQGFILNMGDVGSGMFVLAIALHTWYSVILGRKIPYSLFTMGILGIWAFVALLTVVGPATKGPHFFAKTNAWCWIDSKYDLDRLWLHYIWVFIVEFGTIIIYAHIFLHLRKRLNSIRSVSAHRHSRIDNTAKLSQAARYMILYPIIYIVLTLPLAAGRMSAQAGRNPSLAYYCIAGSFLTSCGWLDTLLYTLTRRVFVKSDHAGGYADRPRPNTASTYPFSNGTGVSGRRWLRSMRSNTSLHPGLPHHVSHTISSNPPVDPNWPLSTFASVTVDFKDPDTGSEEGIGDYRTGTPARIGTPTEVERTHAITETKIAAVGKASESREGSPMPGLERGILSETTIEVVSVSRDELMNAV